MVYVERRSLATYLEIIGRMGLPDSRYKLVDVLTEVPVDRINKLENKKIH